MTGCPLCKQPVAIPSLEDVIAACRLNGFEAKLLRAVWAGKGSPVQTGQIFDAMYEDDPDGGPTQTRMYLEFRRALSGLNSKIECIGMAVRGVGYRNRWRISFARVPA